MANKPGINIVVLVERRFKGEQTKTLSAQRATFFVRPRRQSVHRRANIVCRCDAMTFSADLQE